MDRFQNLQVTLPLLIWWAWGHWIWILLKHTTYTYTYASCIYFIIIASILVKILGGVLSLTPPNGFQYLKKNSCNYYEINATGINVISSIKLWEPQRVLNRGTYQTVCSGRGSTFPLRPPFRFRRGILILYGQGIFHFNCLVPQVRVIWTDSEKLIFKLQSI